MTDFRGKGGVQPDGSTSGKKKKGKKRPFVKGKGKPMAKKKAPPAPPRPSPIQAAMAPPMAGGGGSPGC